VNFLCGGAERDKPEWLDHSKWVFEAHEAGDFDLIIPTIVIAEVAGCGQIRGNHLSRQVRRGRIKVVADWIQQANFIPAEITLDTAIRAAELAIEFQLSGADATVLAIAEMYHCAWLFTWDDGLLKIDQDLGNLKVLQPQREYPDQSELLYDS
jgi:predicted nucleic acid-binding protein